MGKLYLCSDEKLVTDATVFCPFTNKGFRRTILAVVESSQLGSSAQRQPNLLDIRSVDEIPPIVEVGIQELETGFFIHCSHA